MTHPRAVKRDEMSHLHDSRPSTSTCGTIRLSRRIFFGRCVAFRLSPASLSGRLSVSPNLGRRMAGPVTMQPLETERLVILISSNHADLFRYIFALLPNPDDAQDVLQETLLELARKFAE